MPDGQPQVRVAVTTLRMDPLSAEQLEEYLAGGQWEGKAGAFGYQDRLGWVHVLAGERVERGRPAAGAAGRDACLRGSCFRMSGLAIRRRDAKAAARPQGARCWLVTKCGAGTITNERPTECRCGAEDGLRRPFP